MGAIPPSARLLGVIMKNCYIEVEWDANIEPFPSVNSARFHIKPTTSVQVAREVILAIQCENLSNVPVPAIKVKSVYNSVESQWYDVFVP